MVLAEEARKAASLLVDHEYVRVVARAGDGDSLAAGALLSLAIEREGVDYHFSTLPVLDEVGLRRLKDERNEVLVLVDLPVLDARHAVGLAGSLVLVHDADATPDVEDAVAVTADEAARGTECAASTLAFAIARALSRRNTDLAPLALAGPFAEGQHAGGGLRGLNAEFAAEALESRALVRESGLALPGGSLLEAVAQGVEPYFTGLGGRARLAQKFLKDARLPLEDAPEALAPDAAERVASALALRLLEAGAPDGAVDALAAPRWRAPEGALAGETPVGLARRYRAAASRGGTGAAVAWLWDRAGLDAALADAERALHEQALSALVRAERDVSGARGALVVEAPDALSARAVADLAATSLAPARVPVLAWAEAGERLVVAGRASRARVLDGLDLGAAFRASAAALGGHAVGNRASGVAHVPAAARQSLLAALQAAMAVEAVA